MSSEREPYLDEHGKTLTDYPRPSVAVDTAVLTVAWDMLWIVLVRTATGEERLPGTFLHEGETLERAVRRSLRDKAGIRANNPQQLHVFDDPARDDRGWVLSVAFLDAIPHDQIRPSEHTRLVPVTKIPRLSYDHNDIVAFAVDKLRADYENTPDPWRLLPDTEDGILIRDLRALHEAIAGGDLGMSADTFRRKMIDAGLEGTGELRSEGPGKPAQVFSITATLDTPYRKPRPRTNPKTR